VACARWPLRMMDPTCSDTVVTTVQEAHCVMYAVLCGVKPLIHRRPCNEDERSSIRSGAVFVWEEGVSVLLGQPLAITERHAVWHRTLD
jgi:hypothetical protein